MPIAHVALVFEHQSALPRDRVVNTFTFQKGSAFSTSDYAAMVTSFDSFLQTVQAGGVAVGAILGPQLSRSALPSIRSYIIDGHLDGTPAGSPANISSLAALPAPLDPNPLPSEVALCLSYNADYVTDFEFAPGSRPRQRDRGRIFVGPLIRTVVEMDSTTHRPHPSTSVMTSLQQAAATLKADMAPLDWVVWSRKNAAVKPVVAVSVDDAFDTQRRRGERASSRALTTLP
jgi:hypothetical protein